MRIATWNVNSIKQRVGHLVGFLDEAKPDVVCLQELKCQDEGFPRAEIEAEVLANRIDESPLARGEGWRAVWRDTAVCTVCGEACKRATLPAGEIVFVGDGYSDLCAAKAATRVFARDRLCGYLDAAGVAWEPYDDLFDVLRALG